MTARDDAGIVVALRDFADAHIDGSWACGEGALTEAQEKGSKAA